MLSLFSHLSTWLIFEIFATTILTLLNFILPFLLIFNSYRTLMNFYLSSIALSSSLINSLYLFYLIQTIRSKFLSELNCRAMYYFQTSCIIVLAYTVVAIHVNFLFILFSSSKIHQSTCRCLQTFADCFRRFIRRFCFCCVLLIWALSYMSTIPLLYTIDSNDKIPRSVYCPGLKQINYFEEWFDRNRFTQTFICHLLPLFISLVLTIIALVKLFGDFLYFFYCYLKTLKCFQCRKIPSESLESTVTLLPLSSSSSSNSKQKCLRLYIRFIFVLSCCLLACIYPIVMHFYLIYFSVLIPLIYAVCNHSLVQPERIEINRENSMSSPIENNPIYSKQNESMELQSSVNNEESSSTSTIYSTLHPESLSISRNKRKSFANHLYENTRNILNNVN